MGYEVKFYYHERLEAGGYNKEETKDMKRRIGDAYEDVSLDKLAVVVMAQLARRDIWVVDLEVYEYTKKKINFRETRGGIVIKNKKFLLDQSGSGNIVSEEVRDENQQDIKYPHESVQKQKYPHESDRARGVTPTVRPKKRVTFMPSYQVEGGDRVKMLLAKSGARLTVEKDYSVIREFMSPSGIGMMYKLNDDSGREVEISDELFVPAETNLFADRELGFSQSTNKKGDGLVWSGVVDGNSVPDIRRK